MSDATRHEDELAAGAIGSARHSYEYPTGMNGS